MNSFEDLTLSISGALQKEAESLLTLIKNERKIYNISITSLSLALTFFKESYIVFEENEESAYKLFLGIKNFSAFFNIPEKVIFLSSEGSDRLSAIFEIIHNKNRKIITTISASRINPDIENLYVHLKKGQSIERQILKNKILEAGYREVEMVMEEGEFSHHGWIFDIWITGSENPVRIEFFGDEIEDIKLFYPDTQRSFKEKDEIWIIPAVEKEATVQILEFLEFHTIFTAEKDFEDEMPDLIKISHMPLQFSPHAVNAMDKTFAGLGVLPQERKNILDFPKTLKSLKTPLLFVVNSHAQAETIKEILFNYDILAPVIHKNKVGNYSGKYAITVSDLDGGFYRDNLIIITNAELFAEKPFKKKKTAIQKIPVDGLEINEGEYIVHRDHGIGIFRGIKRQKYEDIEEDVLVVEYKDGDILYVPVWGIEKFYRYSVREGFIPALDKLGSNRWQKAKERVRKRIQDIADRLLRLYARRKTPRRFIYSEDTEIHKNFDDFFVYEETEDQKKAIDEILKKMRQPLPLEILLCGDAGYGKTEVAMRAAFRAVFDGKQVAVLVPTTLLCEQHYRTFKRRFEAFSVKIEYLSRFRSEEQIKKVIEDTKHGKVDILIGTHMMILKDVEFFDLGLLIIDEEQRFGVIQKEKLKEKYPEVDLIMITATPIPRTLQIGLSGLWDIFVIQTPPKERLAVRTFIIHENSAIIKEAIEREIQRGGQVFFLHNKIHDIEFIYERLKRLVPYARIAIAHGRMKEKVLDRTMLDFLDGKIDVLLCTSIIASGLDIPNVNTIIIDQAHTFGLGDLYQIRGRVGRSSRQANAYLIVPPEETLTENAKRRIKAIQEMSYLGAGFHIALKDLEIRGAGELLGVEQSGINRIGFDLYIEMLNEAIKEARGEVPQITILPEIKVSVSAFIPEDFIKETSMRIRIYRKLSQTAEPLQLQKLYEEVFDRFGRLPQEVENLFKVAHLRILASKIKAEKVQQKKTGFRFTIQSVHNLIDILSNFKKKGIIKDLRFYPEGFEIEEKNLDRLILLLERAISKIEEKVVTESVKIIS